MNKWLQLLISNTKHHSCSLNSRLCLLKKLDQKLECLYRSMILTIIRFFSFNTAGRLITKNQSVLALTSYSCYLQRKIAILSPTARASRSTSSERSSITWDFQIWELNNLDNYFCTWNAPQRPYHNSFLLYFWGQTFTVR